MTKEQRNAALLEEQKQKFYARGGRTTKLEASDSNFHDFMAVPADSMNANDFLRG